MKEKEERKGRKKRKKEKEERKGRKKRKGEKKKKKNLREEGSKEINKSKDIVVRDIFFEFHEGRESF